MSKRLADSHDTYRCFSLTISQFRANTVPPRQPKTEYMSEIAKLFMGLNSGHGVLDLAMWRILGSKFYGREL